ncbi:sugar-binding regulatory protein [Streptococcus equi subsp. zooepidemicus Sz35]|uniref:sugar-binding transcriptional regulator n=1 Tax=Streptococcus equi TaxID=1336 RepID=UPI0005B9A6E5|nr:sugar-binding transcriptional regulator [Streptococcus equi]KIS17852.1 sugar-binding regulatory protein [Streptococcus equi subsp. zooepidemicus Sz35]MCD3371992.1 sugar-binding transcriptional regulator [Streptococcus equi subsp. zooepidemicus]MCD3403822.1 sugar-binding transcriptional regulator [Streptococcus equi subsp. zooepidemicus]MCD3428523.1 sugar-binding transcriptional regulator [Streptococcus equi subsp. zooepidemicus]MCD3441265.1 sugar-binding transcriptional regulator [Streptoco
MKEERKRLLAKVAYLHYVQGKSQTAISKEMNIYRTTVCRMLAKARAEGIVRIEIADYDANLFALEEYVRQKYGLEKLDIVSNQMEDSPSDTLVKVAKTAAEVLRSTIKDGDKIGLSWGATLSSLIDELDPKAMKDIMVCPLAGGPSHINAKFHVNTLVYRLARIFHGNSSFINAMVVQEDKQLTRGILQSKYFEDTLAYWNHLDLALVGIGGEPNGRQTSQWRDLLTDKDYKQLADEKAVGEVCCRFFDQEGHGVHQELQDRTIGISLEQLARVPKTIAVAVGQAKAKAILAALKAKFINYLITDKATIMAVLALDQDQTAGTYLS